MDATLFEFRFARSKSRTRRNPMIIKCDKCGQKNRVPAERAVDRGTCGKCGESLEVTAKPRAVDAEQFADVIANSPIPVLVDFWSPTCGPCLMVAPELEKLAAQSVGKLLVVKLNTQSHPRVAAQQAVRAVPTFALFEGGERKRTEMGFMPASVLASKFGV